MDSRLVNKYLMGLIANKGASVGNLPRNITFDDDRQNLIAKVLLKLISDNSSMTSDIILEALELAVVQVAGTDEWLSEQAWFQSFVYAAEECGVSKRELEELFDIIQRQRISEQARRMITRLLEDDEFGEEAINNALKKLRLLKAVYPSKSAMLDEQSADAVHDALNANAGIIPYGFAPIDDLMAGVFRKEITVLAGRPGHGKTSAVCQFVLNWIQNGIKVLFVSKEMPASRLMHKFISNIGNISSDEIKRGAVEDPDYLHSVADAFVRKFKDKLFIYDDVYSADEVERLILKHKPDIVVDDFIQLSDFGGKDMRIGITETMKHYKQVAKETNVAFVVLSQLNRSIEGREDPIPRMSDLAESGSLEQLAAYVCFIYYQYKVDYDEENKSRIKFIAAKTRYGESATIPLGFDGNKMRYYAVPQYRKQK